MAYVFLSDGRPDAEDYDSNYFYFDESNLQAVNIIEKMLVSNDERDLEFRTRLHKICQSSFNNEKAKTKNNNRIGGIIGLFKSFKI